MRQQNALCAALKCAIDLGELLSRKRHKIKPLVKRKFLSFGITIQLNFHQFSLTQLLGEFYFYFFICFE